MTTTGYFAILPAPGWHGDFLTVEAVYHDRDRAIREAGRSGQVIAGSSLKQGEKVGRGVVDDMLARGDWWRVR